MKQYNMKRAIITITGKKRLSWDKETLNQINLYQRDIKKYTKLGLKFDSPKILSAAKKIKEYRQSLKTTNLQRLVFDVYVKQYKNNIEIEYEFPMLEYGAERTKALREMIKEVTNQAIRGIRSWNKDETLPSKFGKYRATFLSTRRKGRVFAKEGEILRIYIEKNIKSLYEDKLPTEPRKYIGIELEFCAPIKEQQFALKLFRSGIHKFAQLKKDASLRPHEDKKEIGYELAILLEESNYKKRLKQITAILQEVGAIAKDRRAGLHVHLDMRRRNKELVYSNLVACQYALLSIVDPQRYNNEFCRVVDSRKFPTEFTGERSERYKTINAAAFYKYKTLEVRMHEGSVDYAQISNWIDLLIKISNYPKKFKSDVLKVSVLNKRINLDKKLYSYLTDRSCFWQVQNSDQTRNMRNSMDNEINRLRTAISQDMLVTPPLAMPAHPSFALTYDGVTNTVGSVSNRTGISASWNIEPDQVEEN